jgi:acyl-CoA reductase-like NAD-dependent aldehyde dehydrogenase
VSIDNTHLNLIGGEWIPASDAQENRSPSDRDDLIGLYAQANAAEVDAAVQAARRAATSWWNAGPQVRADVLDAVGATLLARKSDLGRLLAREEGKTLAEAIAEVSRAGQIFKFFAGEALRLATERLDSVRPHVDIEVLREPVGVIGIITPWNFPIAIPAWKIAPALAFGNTVVVKPADLTPASVHALAKILVECGCPAGVFNLVMGRGRVVGNALIEHRDINAISFTGSVAVGRDLVARCAGLHKKVQAELGGKNPLIVMGDADLRVAVAACVSGAFGSTGQRCTATSRVIVETSILDAFTRELVAACQSIVVGHALDPATTMGPVVSAAQLNGNLEYVDVARKEGAKVIGGNRITEIPSGNFQRPALFLNATNEMRSSREEIFGPCVSVIQAEEFEHAVALANDSPFGLAAGICTRSLKYAREFKRRSHAGMVMVNLPTAGVDYHVPFGGRKGSSYGSREQGTYAREFYTDVKTSYTLAV